LNNIQKLINNERINIIRYYPDFNNTLLSTLNSSDIISYLVEDGENEKDKKNITVVCPIDKQRQLLGPSGENIRICSQLLNARIEIINPEEAEYLTNDKELKNNQFIPADYSNIKIIRPRHSLTSEERATSASRRSNSANITNNRDGEVNSTNGSRPPRSGGRSNARSSSINEFISTEDRKKQQLEINKFKRNDIDEDEE
jgi:hypothetical protein